MKHRDVDVGALREAVRRQPPVFRTMDIADDPCVRQAHNAFLDRYFNPGIGAALSRHRELLAIELLAATGGNATWRRIVAARPDPTSPGGPQASRSGRLSGPADLGPQFAGDPPFRALMRSHQSWYRATRLGAPFGVGPTATSTTPYGSMLAAEAAEAGANFVTPAIFERVKRRVAEGPGVEPFRCLRNMLSSQPLCFNLFGPLADDLQLASRLLRSVVPDVDRVTEITFETAPAPAAEYLGDRTAFDVVIRYLTPDLTPAIIGVEVKLTEPFSPKVYDTLRYRALTEAVGSPFARAGQEALADSRWNQLWRNHLLVEAVRGHPSTAPRTLGRLAVVRHPLDLDTHAAVQGYSALLADPAASLLDWPLDHLTQVWSGEVDDGPVLDWLDELRLRYVDLDASRSTRVHTGGTPLRASRIEDASGPAAGGSKGSI